MQSTRDHNVFTQTYTLAFLFTLFALHVGCAPRKTNKSSRNAFLSILHTIVYQLFYWFLNGSDSLHFLLGAQFSSYFTSFQKLQVFSYSISFSLLLPVPFSLFPLRWSLSPSASLIHRARSLFHLAETSADFKCCFCRLVSSICSLVFSKRFLSSTSVALSPFLYTMSLTFSCSTASRFSRVSIPSATSLHRSVPHM